MTHAFVPASIARLLIPAVLALGACKSSDSSASTSSSTTPDAAASEKGHAQITAEYTATAQVVAIDSASRTITLRNEDGTLHDVHAGSEVRNFDRIKVADVVRVRYKESLVATKLAPGTALGPAQAAFASGRAKPGAMPAAGAGVAISVRVKVESVDLDKGIVSYSRASGEMGAHRVKTDEGREFVKGLQPGDIVQLDAEQIIALSVETP
jgi:hypothetical protein